MEFEFPDKPVWKPLQAAVGSRCREFMFMGKSGRIYLYKHIWTRRYINLNLNGQAYRYTGHGYEPIPKDEAIKNVFG